LFVGYTKGIYFRVKLSSRPPQPTNTHATQHPTHIGPENLIPAKKLISSLIKSTSLATG